MIKRKKIKKKQVKEQDDKEKEENNRGRRRNNDNEGETVSSGVKDDKIETKNDENDNIQIIDGGVINDKKMIVKNGKIIHVGD